MRKAATKKVAPKKTTTKRAPKKGVSQARNASGQNVPPISFERNDYGLLEGVEHTFDESGLVDWRKLIPMKYIALNREKFLKKQEPIDTDSLSNEEVEVLKSKAKDEDLIIKLGGYRALANIRGLLSVREDVVASTPDFVSIVCTITWMGNYETGMNPVSFSASADAHAGNCAKDFGSNYLTATASNRAFSRAVRNFLRIAIVSQDELSFEKPDEVMTASGGVSPSTILDKKIASANLDFEAFKALLDEEDYEFVGKEAWKSTKDIPSKFLPVIFGCLARKGS